MWFFFKIILSFLDYFNQKKIYSKIKERIGNELDVVIDVGAHIGETIQILNSNFKINKIIAFEPSKHNYKRLEVFVGKKKYKNTEIYNFACGKEDKIENLNFAVDSSSSSLREINENSKYFKMKRLVISGLSKKEFFKKEKIQIRKLNDFFVLIKDRSIDLLKIDTEGFELDVLIGAEKILNNTKMIYFEHHYDNMIKKNYTFTDINKFLVEKNFKKTNKFKMPLRKTFEYIYINNNFDEKKD